LAALGAIRYFLVLDAFTGSIPSGKSDGSAIALMKASGGLAKTNEGQGPSNPKFGLHAFEDERVRNLGGFPVML
jgi:hypothetical protein